MKHTEVRVSELQTYDDHMRAIDEIRSDWRNIEGGWERWISGLDTRLKTVAIIKIAAIELRAERLFSDDFRSTEL